MRRGSILQAVLSCVIGLSMVFATVPAQTVAAEISDATDAVAVSGETDALDTSELEVAALEGVQAETNAETEAEDTPETQPSDDDAVTEDESGENASTEATVEGSEGDVATAEDATALADADEPLGTCTPDGQQSLSEEEDTLASDAGIDEEDAEIMPLSNVSYRVPVDQNGHLRITQEFTGSNLHSGMDIAPYGAYSNDTINVYASAEGTVVASVYGTGSSWSYGNYVKIKHDDGCYTLYAHLQSRSVSAGQRVSQGQVIGIMGSTGNSSGKHVHFEYRKNGASLSCCRSAREIVTFPGAGVAITESNSSGGGHSHNYSQRTNVSYSFYNNVRHKIYYTPTCSCGATAAAVEDLEECNFEWVGFSRQCTKCGTRYVDHDNGDYVARQNAIVTSGQNPDTTQLTTVPSGTLLKVSDTAMSGWGRWVGKVTYKGVTGWVQLWDFMWNGTAGKHNFSGDTCKDCGIRKVSTEPGKYILRNDTVMYYQNVFSSTTASMTKGTEITIVATGVTSNGYWWGRNSYNYLIGMDQLENKKVGNTRNGTVTTIRDGDYEILCSEDKNFGVNVSGGGTANGTNIQVYQNDGTDSMKFHFSRNDDGSYTITSVLYGHGKVLDVDNSGMTNGSNVQLWSPHGGGNQRWFVEKNSNGTYSFRLVSSDLYLDVHGGTVANFSNIQVHEGNQSAAQQFVLKRLGVVYRTVTFNSNGGSSVAKQTVENGDKVTKPKDPTRSGYTFKGWYTDKALTKAFNFSTVITSNVTLYAKWAQSTGRVTMTRLYNRWSGEHLYTSNATEVKKCVALGWKNEGTAWIAPSKSSTPVYRLYNPYSGDHHYTTSKKEYDACKKAGWRQEGIAWYSDDAKGVPLYRGFNRYVTVGTHHYTTSKTELNTMVKNGWKAEGIAWYGLK